MHSSVATSQENELYPQGRPRGRVEDLPIRPDTTETDLANDTQTSQNVCEFCNRTFKNQRGVKIHQGRMKCKTIQEDRRETQVNRKTQGNMDQEQNHSILEASPADMEEASSPTLALEPVK